MITIRPTNRLPYANVPSLGDKHISIKNNTNALSAVAPIKTYIDAQALGVIHNAAAYASNLTDSTSSPHVVSLRTSWKNRKTP